MQLDLALLARHQSQFAGVHVAHQEVAVAVHPGAVLGLPAAAAAALFAWKHKAFGFHQGPQKRFFQHAAAVAGVAAGAGNLIGCAITELTGSLQQGITHQRLRALHDRIGCEIAILPLAA